MKIGFIGLGHVGAKLAANLVRHGFDTTVRDLDPDAARGLLEAGATWADSPAEIAERADVIITCLPSPAATAAVVEGAGGILATLRPGAIWAEMSTNSADEVLRLGTAVEARGGEAIECPVSGGCHRAATGNISILAGGRREVFERMLPLLTVMGRRVLHTGALGTASRLKVLTNYLATANLVSLCEAMVTAEAAGLDAATTFEAIRISSGNSFVHETESRVILGGSRDINFTMELVLKDIGLFQAMADAARVPLELSPLLIRTFEDGRARYGGNEWSPNIIRRLEDATGVKVLADGFPAEIVDDEPPETGYEVRPGVGATG